MMTDCGLYNNLVMFDINRRQQFAAFSNGLNPVPYLSMTCFAAVIVLATVTGKTSGRIDSAVNFMLGDIVPWMRHCPVRSIFEFVARLDLFLMRVAVSAEGLRMADAAGLMLLRSVEFVPHDVINAVVHR